MPPPPNTHTLTHPLKTHALGDEGTHLNSDDFGDDDLGDEALGDDPPLGDGGSPPAAGARGNVTQHSA